VVDRAVLGSVGFAVSALNVPLIMVLGHVRCGAVDATVTALRAGDRPTGTWDIWWMRSSLRYARSGWTIPT